MPKPPKMRITLMVHTLTPDQYLAERVQLFRRQYGVSRAAAHAAVLEFKPAPDAVHCDACIQAAKTGVILPGNVVTAMTPDNTARLFNSVPGYLSMWLKFQTPDILEKIALTSETYKGAPLP